MTAARPRPFRPGDHIERLLPYVDRAWVTVPELAARMPRTGGRTVSLFRLKQVLDAAVEARQLEYSQRVITRGTLTDRVSHYRAPVPPFDVEAHLPRVLGGVTVACAMSPTGWASASATASALSDGKPLYDAFLQQVADVLDHAVDTRRLDRWDRVVSARSRRTTERLYRIPECDQNSVTETAVEVEASVSDRGSDSDRREVTDGGTPTVQRAGQVLAYLRQRARPATRRDVQEALELTESSARRALYWLVEHRQARVGKGTPDGPGRPPKVYWPADLPRRRAAAVAPALGAP